MPQKTQNFVKLQDSYDFIKEGDVVFFYPVGFTGWAISFYGDGKYCHVGMTTFSGEILEFVEFKEFYGGRTVNFNHLFDQYKKADVYRVSPEIKVNKFNKEKDEAFIDHYRFDGRITTNFMRSLTGLPYGWDRIAIMGKKYLPFVRLLYPANTNDDDDSQVYPVCSTAVTLALRKTFIDPVPNLVDYMVNPSMLSRSPILNYMFTIEK